METSNVNIIDQALGIIELFENNQILARLYGGVAIWINCPSSHKYLIEKNRRIKDVDIICKYSELKAIRNILLHNDYVENIETPFLKYKKQYFIKEGVLFEFVFDELNYCHRIALKNRLINNYPTITIPDLFLSKMQNVNLPNSYFDFLDVRALLFEYKFIEGEYYERVSKVLLNDYGFYKTFLMNMEFLEKELQGETEIGNHVILLKNKLLDSKKNIYWKIQKIFTNKNEWYNFVE
ncbi:MAG: hypothetical protein NTY07_15455 [Bacteroidia bacterium]|nr:hypothetical protein [Bacteroidia bacterium]